jgi:hypothetical protein
VHPGISDSVGATGGDDGIIAWRVSLKWAAQLIPRNITHIKEPRISAHLDGPYRSVLLS